MKNVYNNILELIGNTPIVKLNRLGSDKHAAIYAKLEYLNPAGSIKDRIALHIINKAEEEKELKPGGTIVENTSGNTGAGLAMVAAVKDYKAIFTIPDKMSSEKINFMKSFGAKVVVTPTNVPAESPQSYYETAKRIYKGTENSFYVNQYNNAANPEAHYKTTGPEIWEQMDGDIDYLVAGIGTGGTLSGTARYLKEKNPKIKVIAVDPEGSVFYDYFKKGKPGEPHVYQLEGIGEDMMVDAMDFNVVDDIIQVSDKDGFDVARALAQKEGIFAGGSSGAAVWGALQVAKSLPPDKKIVTILPDTGFRYMSKFFSDEWMRDKGYMQSSMHGSVGDVSSNDRHLETTESQSSVKEVIDKLKKHNISQMPVIDDGEFIGLITENAILQHLTQGSAGWHDPIVNMVQTHVTVLQKDAAIQEAVSKIKNGESAVLVQENGKIVDILTKIDLIEFLGTH